MKDEDKNKNDINNIEENNRFLNKVFKFITKEKREIIGCLKAYNKEGHFYLVDCVELFDKESEHFATNELFQNNDEHTFYYESEKNQYQYINNCVFPLEEIGDIYMLKDDVYNDYKKKIDDYLKEKQLKEEQKKEEEKKLNQINNEEKVEDNNNDKNESNENILNSIQKNKKNKNKKKKKKK